MGWLVGWGKEELGMIAIGKERFACKGGGVARRWVNIGS